ncbi:MAG: hypothetical protein Q9O74_02445 [Planctomycetota bacterium]|nr:hypothetical protein [Planctomycetota bacterium]
MLRGFQIHLQPFTDDRGRPFRFRDVFGLGDDEDETDDPAREKDDPWDRLLDGHHEIMNSVWGILALGIITFVALALRLSFWFVVPLVLFVIAGVSFVTTESLLTPFFASRGYECIHQAVRNGRCPACRYKLVDIEEDAQGFITCPECGAAWRADRLRAAEAPGNPQARQATRSKLVQVLQFPKTSLTLDHRGRPASLVLYRPSKKKPGDAYETRCQRASKAVYSRVSGRGALLSIGLIVLGAGAFVCTLAYGLLNPAGTPWWVYAIIPLMAALLFAGLLFRRGELWVSLTTIEHETLAQSLCPSCWELLECIPPNTEGCTMCPECGSSWRLPRSGLPS